MWHRMSENVNKLYNKVTNDYSNLYENIAFGYLVAVMVLMTMITIITSPIWVLPYLFVKIIKK